MLVRRTISHERPVFDEKSDGSIELIQPGYVTEQLVTIVTKKSKTISANCEAVVMYATTRLLYCVISVCLS